MNILSTIDQMIDKLCTYFYTIFFCSQHKEIKNIFIFDLSVEVKKILYKENGMKWHWNVVLTRFKLIEFSEDMI